MLDQPINEGLFNKMKCKSTWMDREIECWLDFGHNGDHENQHLTGDVHDEFGYIWSDEVADK